MRRAYLDWLRGVATLLMVEAHTYDAWTRVEDREGWPYKSVIALGGFAAPAFLFLAGVALALGAARREDHGVPTAEAARRARRRGWQIVGLAFLFRLQSMIVSGGRFPQALLKVDILNILGLSMLAVGALWGVSGDRRRRAAIFAAAGAMVVLAAPWVGAAAWPAALPEWAAMYLRAVPGRTSFSLFPWPAFTLAGAVVGLALAPARESADEARVTRAVGFAGLACVGIGAALSLAPRFYDASAAWTTAPPYFLMRLGALLLAVPAARAWSARLPGSRTLTALGVSSLFVYWIHVEMAYGRPVRPLARALDFPQATAGYLLLVLLLWWLVHLKTRLLERRRSGQAERLASGASGS